MPLVLALLVSLCEPEQLRAEERFTDSYAETIQSFLHDKFARGNEGMVIGLLDEHGSRVFGAGKLDNGTDQEVNGDTIFEIGSVTKVFTVLLALEMKRRGELKLDDPVSKYLPEHVKVPAHGGKEITLLNLASQDSGLPFHLGKDRNELPLKELKQAPNGFTAGDLYASLSEYQLTNDPGNSYQYSNVGMGLLGHLMELKADTDYESLVVSRICRPLNMDSTRIKLTPELEARLARGHLSDGGPSGSINLGSIAGAGALRSTANDLLKFLRANLGFTRTELSPPMEEMRIVRHTSVPRFGKTATPWWDEGVYHPPGSELWGHAGGTLGYLSFVGFDKEKRRGVVVLSNQSNVNPSGVGWAILQGMELSRENVTYLVREIVGLGVALDTDKTTGVLQITTVYPKSPAGQAGLSKGHLIRKINDVTVENKSIPECLGMMGGPAGTKVRLELFDPERKETKTVELTRRTFVTATYGSRK